MAKHSNERSSEIQYLMARAALQDLLVRYFQGLDRCSPEQVRSCFTDDIQAHYDQRPPTRGIEELINSLQNFNKLREGKMRITTHFMGIDISLLRAKWPKRRLCGGVSSKGKGAELGRCAVCEYIDGCAVRNVGDSVAYTRG